MTAVADPLLVVASLARPGGNVTGLTTLASDLHPKRLELLKEIAPTAMRVGLMNNMSNPQGRRQWEELELAARSVALQALLLDTRTVADIASAFATARDRGVGAMIVPAAGLMRNNRRLMSHWQPNTGCPRSMQTREFVEEGGLMAYGPSYPRSLSPRRELHRQNLQGD